VLFHHNGIERIISPEEEYFPIDQKPMDMFYKDNTKFFDDVKTIKGHKVIILSGK
jgi:hypothetical protein